MCEVLGVSRSGFHGWERRAPSDRALSDAWLTSRITEIHERARGVYGSRRVQAELRLGQGIRVSRRRVRRLMRQAGISGLVKVKRGRTTIRVRGSHDYPLNAFVTSASAEELGLVDGADLDSSIAGRVVGSLLAVIVAAYDAETFIIWEPSS